MPYHEVARTPVALGSYLNYWSHTIRKRLWEGGKGAARHPSWHPTLFRRSCLKSVLGCNLPLVEELFHHPVKRESVKCLGEVS